MKAVICFTLLVPFMDAFLLNINTVPELDVPKYLGRWYQMYASESVALWFEQGASCVTANYALANDGTGRIKVLNTQQLKDGTEKDISGYATPSKEPGKLSVALEGVPLSAPYWVIKLGPVVDNTYQYAIVTDNFKATLFVLARNTTNFKEQYESDVMQFLKEQGFSNIINKPVATNQGPNCHYPPQ